MNILIIAPHQDDEILAAGLLIQSCLCAGDNIFIAFATNGDRNGREAGVRRYQESVRALQLLGVKEEHIFYLGYGDTGMRLEHSFLYHLFYENDHILVPTPVSRQTYHPAGKPTLHYACTGREADYCRNSFLDDLNRLLDVCQAQFIVLPSGLDRHGDHRACFLFMDELRHKRKTFPPMLSYLIHAGNDMLWPNRIGDAFSRPPGMDSGLWEHRIRVSASEMDRQRKQTCISCFHSQEPLAQNRFLLSFAKKEEIFFPCWANQPTINIFPLQK